MFEGAGNARHLLLFFICSLDQKHCTSYSAFLYVPTWDLSLQLELCLTKENDLNSVWEGKGKGQTELTSVIS